MLGLGIVTIVLAVLEQLLLARSRYFWLGGVIPVSWTVVLAVVVLQNVARLAVPDYFLLIIAVIIPYVCWGNGYQRGVDHRTHR